jgi:polyphosphate kinase
MSDAGGMADSGPAAPLVPAVLALAPPMPIVLPAAPESDPMATRETRAAKERPRRGSGPKPAPAAASSVSQMRPAVATGPIDPTNLDDPRLYINRELSMLEFNRRVLALARDPATPLLERLRFLVICSTNLDEFFEIRVSGLKQQLEYRVASSEPDGLSASEALARISQATHEIVQQQYTTLQDEILPAMRAEGIFILRRSEWDDAQRKYLREYFEDQVLPVLTPIAVDPSHPFPRILNKSLSIIVSLEGADAFGRQGRVAVVQVPRSLPRIVALPKALSSQGRYVFVRVSSLVREFIGDLFRGMTIRGAHQFRVTRDSDLWVDEEAVDDLLSAIKGELGNRAFGDAVRLVVADNCSKEMERFLLEQFGLSDADLYRVDGPVNLHRLAAIYDLVDRPDLKYPQFVPGLTPDPNAETDIFARMRKGDMVLHHPFESFGNVVELARQAAADPNVLSIKLTLYRTGDKSPFEQALIDAARAGKDVTAVIELRARFDEAANIGLASRLQEAGANVAYGIVGYKAHAKMMLVVRREEGGLRRYVHLGTGNYHPGTARAYTDFSYFTTRPEVGRDVHQIFMQLTGMGSEPELRTLVSSPFTLEPTLLRLIDAEIAAAKAGQPAHIMARMNAISEPGIMQALYRASQAGVKVDLVIRGVCCLRPGVPGVSDNIRVRSILGRFLEHSRVYCFLAGGQWKTFCASADWMTRNLHRRVEVAFPVDEAQYRDRIIAEALTLYLADNTQAWELGADGLYRRLAAVDASGAPVAPVSAQKTLLEKLAKEQGRRDPALPPGTSMKLATVG